MTKQNFFEGVAIGDLHLDKPNLKEFDDPLDLQLKSIKRVYEYARSNGIQHVFFLGDICEYTEMSEPARVGLLSLLKSYDEQGFNQYIYPGNHDYAFKGSHSIQTLLEVSSKKYFRNTTITDTALNLEIEGVPISLLSYPFKEPNTNKSRLCFAHYEVSGAVGDNGRRSSSSDELHIDNHQYIQGHLHTPQTVKNHWYPGTMYQLSNGEKSKKGFGHFKAFYENKKVSIKKKHIAQLPLFQFKELFVSSLKDLKALEVNEPNVKWKVWCQEDVSLPDDFHTKYPNVINSLKFKDKKEIEELSEELVLEETNLTLLSHKAILPDYLRSKNYSEEKIKKVLSVYDSLEIGKKKL